MTTTQTPEYIKALLTPTRSSRGSRKAWSIDLETTWLPFFTATNVMGETELPDEVLGAPVRLSKNPDGEVKFSSTGRPVMRVHPELNAQIGIVRENFIAGLTTYTGAVMEEMADDYAEQVKRSGEAGLPHLEQDQQDITDAVAKLEAEKSQEETAQEPAAAAAKPTSRSSRSETPEVDPSLAASETS